VGVLAGVRASMGSNRDRDSGPELALRSAVHARLPTFPPGFCWYGSRLQITRRIGNGFPHAVAAAVARTARAMLDAMG